MDFKVEKWKLLRAILRYGSQRWEKVGLFSWSENCLLGHNLSQLFGSKWEDERKDSAS